MNMIIQKSMHAGSHLLLIVKLKYPMYLVLKPGCTIKKYPKYRTYEKDYKEYSRGHLCASYDRTYSLEANKQTFYYSNMSPQSTAFNTGFWTKFEQSIKAPNGKNDFVHKLGDNDTLYVVKGGYIDDEEIKYTKSCCCSTFLFYSSSFIPKWAIHPGNGVLRESI